MKRVHIKSKLDEIGVAVDGIVLGDFDFVGEFTAKRERNPSDPNYKRYGCFYRSNYERGILIASLIRQFNLTSMLEIGFGRGYSTFCAARTFHDMGVNGRIVTIDPKPDENHIKALQHVFPREWFSYVTFVKGFSQEVLTGIEGSFDLVYIDGDHSYAATRRDWELTRGRFNKFMLFDDYHMPSKVDKGTIECSMLIDEIDWCAERCGEPELVILDRRIFVDDRGVPDDAVDYGQVLLTRNGVERDDW